MFNNKPPLYVVVRGRRIGIFRSWDRAEIFVKSYSGAKYKKFSTFKEASNYFRENTGAWIVVEDIDKEFRDVEEVFISINKRRQKALRMKNRINENKIISNRIVLFNEQDTDRSKNETN